MVEIADSKLKEIVSRLVAEFSPERVYLFGSKARGDDNENSDYDILLVVPREVAETHLSYEKVAKILWDLKISTPTDVLLWSREEFEERLHLKASFPSTVVREGKLLYAS